MSTSGGDERLLTLYADIHYYFSEPGPRPTQHRFDKESYVYLYRDSATGRGRLEVANHAGTPEQDAFTGYLDNITIHQTFRHPNLCTVTVDGMGDSAQPDQHWRLPSTDPRDEGKYLFRLHTLDLYFWTEADAAQFVHAIASTLRQEQLKGDIIPATSPAPHEEPMSPVVQNLENIAISHGGSERSGVQQQQQQPSEPHDSNSPHPGTATAAAAASAAATAATASTRGQIADDSDSSRQVASPHSNQAYTPLAYNPAAPPAPEKHAHREKTPPPPEGAQGTGLAAAAARDEGRIPQQQPTPTFGPRATPSFGPTATPSFGPGAPSNANLHSPVGSVHGSHAYTPTPSSFSPMPSTISSPPMSPSSQTSHAASAFPGPPPRTTTEQSVGSMGGKTEQTPTNEILGPDFRHSNVPLQHLQPQYPDYLAQRVSQNTPPSTHSPDYHVPGQRPPHGQKLPENVRIGGYSDYNYTSPPPQQPPGGGYHDGNPYQTGDYAIHQQLYRPTEEESQNGNGHKRRSSKHKTPEDRPGRLETGAEKVEKKVNRFLRGIEKRIG